MIKNYLNGQKLHLIYIYIRFARGLSICQHRSDLQPILVTATRGRTRCFDFIASCYLQLKFKKFCKNLSFPEKHMVSKTIVTIITIFNDSMLTLDRNWVFNFLYLYVSVCLLEVALCELRVDMQMTDNESSCAEVCVSAARTPRSGRRAACFPLSQFIKTDRRVLARFFFDIYWVVREHFNRDAFHSAE